MKGWKVALATVGCVAFFVVLYLGFGRDPHEVPFKLQGKPAPAFALKPLQAGSTEPVRLEALHGKPVVINFWASWCGPCRYEHPVLTNAFQRYSTKVHFLGVVFEDTEEKAAEFLRQNGSAYPQLFDPHSRTAVDYGIAGVPETYFIDKNGIISYKHVGPIDPQTFEARIGPLLN